ncbi:acetyl/propionyl/methylcrotonyl-CoA carboxylase subunit alpha [Armatimonas sp.]|uniref:acetyl-CoA carboxylase biotin carboxylase subunit n=1 Tax=Armatimonas sp. TaxID=1872638 RepID=UPI00374DC286
MQRLLIANRGEIAVRVIRACRELGISPVAVYSDADRDAPHVRLADAAVCLGPGPASESYLRSELVLEAARSLGADAVHPGYGFLSENAAFADACAAAKITFVGPPGNVIRALGDKIGAKNTMQAAGVPCVPGYNGDGQADDLLQAEAQKIGTPLLIKASAGGGGRGMRRVDTLTDFLPQLAEARREAKAAFGDDRVLLEKYVLKPRHIEFQIFGDTHGNVVHLFERECSIQRRHQKILEESPSPALTPTLRAQMAAAAVLAGKAAGYVGAGTVEFLVSGDSFYFLEVNTRLQVEHPVTESITGTDLVAWQIAVARGEPLPLTQEQIQSRGHCIEARIYAEDPATGFLPSLGTLRRWREPSGPGIRVDSGYTEGMEIPPFYDPMLAKVIAYGPDRAAALARLDLALSEFVALGVTTNIEYLRTILADTAFIAGELHTGFLPERFTGWKPNAEIPEEVLIALGALSPLAPAYPLAPAGLGNTNGNTNGNAWLASDGWRNAKSS